MSKKDFLAILFLLVSFFAFIFFKHKGSLSYSFDAKLIDRYLRSQDIEDIDDEIKDRIFVSDSDIYISAGYLYSKGNEPTKYNFQHPPLIKYLYGFSIQLFNNPYYTQILLGGLFITLTYILGVKVFDNRLMGLLGSLFMFVDPVFSGMFTEALLDLGQATFSLLYVASVLFYPASFIFQGVSLGLFAASKFWSTTLFFIAALYGYKFLSKKERVNIKTFLLSLIVAVITFSLTYTKSFVDRGGLFNILFFEGRVLKFMLDHNAATNLGGPAFLFLTGILQDWWKGNVSRVMDWTILWPIAFINSIYQVIKIRKINLKFFVFLLPIAYLLYLSPQVPFSRYFIIILPYFYLGLAYSILKVSEEALLLFRR